MNHGNRAKSYRGPVFRILVALACNLSLCPVSWTLATEASHVFEFDINFPRETRAEAFSGRVIVFLSKYAQEPRYSDDWLSRVAVIGADFSEIQPGQSMWISDRNAMSYPVLPSEMERGQYFVQAVMDLGLSSLPPGRSPGNLYSEPTRVRFGNTGDPVKLVCQHSPIRGHRVGAYECGNGYRSYVMSCRENDSLSRKRQGFATIIKARGLSESA